MHIGIDVRPLLETHHSGMQEFTENITEGLLKQAPHNSYTLFATGRDDKRVKKYYQKLLTNFPKVALRYSHLPIANRALNAGRLVLKPLLAKKLKPCAVLFLPNFHIVPLTDIGLASVLVFHDLSFVYGQHFFSLHRQLWHMRANPKKQAQQATRLIAVSHSTAADLQTHYAIEPEKISVVYPGINNVFYKIPRGAKVLKAIREKYNLPFRFILFLAMLEPRKNVENVVKSFEIIADKALMKDVDLVIAGTPGWGKTAQLQFWQALPEKIKSRVHRLTHFDPSDRPAIYNLAHAFFFPSFFEGFGFTPLEAMACGVPTLTSDVSSLPEVTGKAAIHVSPHRIDDLAEALYLICTDKELREELTIRGLAQAQKFKWNKSVKKIIGLLEKTARNN